MTSAARLHDSLRACGASLSTAESLTGGRLAKLLTDVPGSSQTYAGGAVTYWTALKVDLLGVPAELVEEHGVVSAECAGAMAAGIRSATGTTYGLATTGVAGPDTQEGKPVGTVFVGVAGPDGTRATRLSLTGGRAAIQDAACAAALRLLLDRLPE
ncbi:MAG: CinA family protein [Nocardioides sp.]|uniref:CinA family protein n=1 Tax=Nocardioides sp. TaxID=35761 RepID=UPI0039E4E93E